MASATSPPGFFGKLPARGDFLSRRVPSGLAPQWEEWLQAMTASAREAAGAGWPEAWLTAPLWHFALGDALAPPHGIAGVLVASADRVGRLFPFTVLGGCEPGQPPDDTALLRWQENVEELVLDALEDGFDPAALDAALAQLGPPPPVTGPDMPPGVSRLAVPQAVPGPGIASDDVVAAILDGSPEEGTTRPAAVGTPPDAPGEVPPGTAPDLPPGTGGSESADAAAQVASILGAEPEPERTAPVPDAALDSNLDGDLYGDLDANRGAEPDTAPGLAGPEGSGGRPGAGQSVWWCRGSDRVVPVRLCSAGLPGPETAAAMMLGGAAVTPV